MRWFLTFVVALASGFAGAAVWDVTGLGDRATRQYLLANPEVLPEAMQVLQQREQQAAIEPLRGELETPFPGAVLGNPDGAVTLVEFSDYACTYCRQSVADVNALIATEDPGNLAEAERVLKAAVGKDRENPAAWYQLGMVYGAQGDIPRARLASAEQQIMSGRPREALQNATAAEGSLPDGSPDWIRAQDVAMQARAELERERDRN